MRYIVEVQLEGQWTRWGTGNTPRTAEVSAASARRAYPGAKVRIRKVS